MASSNVNLGQMAQTPVGSGMRVPVAFDAARHVEGERTTLTRRPLPKQKCKTCSGKSCLGYCRF